MKTIEIRRHSKRDKSSPHLTQEGLDFARKVGRDMGPYYKVFTSDLPRALETAIAMGFAVDDQIEVLGDYPDDLEGEIEWGGGFPAISEAYRKSKKVQKLGNSLAKALFDLAKETPKGKRILVISHGGLVELALVACLPEDDHSRWGKPFSFCQGGLLSFKEGGFTEVSFLRPERD